MNKSIKGALVLAALFILFVSPAVSAEIIISQPNSLYNFGDDFSIILTIKPQVYTSGYLNSKLVCSTGEAELLRSPLSISPGVEKKIEIALKLDSFIVSGMEGQCHVSAEFGEDISTTSPFKITKNIDVSLKMDSNAFDPGSQVKIQGTAKKENTNLLDGFVEFSVSDIEFTIAGIVDKGSFNLNFTIPDNAPSGSYKLNARVYEKDSFEKIINEGTATGVIRVNQIIKNIDVALSEQSISPVNDLSYTIILYDQAEEHVSADVFIEIYKPDNSLFSKKIARSDETQTFGLESNSTPGYWRIKAKMSDLVIERNFFVEQYKDISFDLQNNTLTIKNTGNIPYSGPVEIQIGGVSEIREISNLKIGSSRKFKLNAPNGEYQIDVAKGTQKYSLGATFLTGNAISVDDATNSLTGKFYILLGLILLLILSIVGVMIYKKYYKGRMLLKPSKSTPTAKTASENASMIDKGEKQESSIIVLNLKNFPEFAGNQEILGVIDSALWKAKESGAKIYTEGDFRIIVFAPILTNQKENAILAANIARSMERTLHTHNRHSLAKIKFGIGVHIGALIVEKKEGNFRFMSLNNVIGSTKRIAQESDSELLVSEAFHRKTVGKIKVIKFRDNLWKIEKVIDRTEHADYTKGTFQRTGGEAEGRRSSRTSHNSQSKTLGHH